MDISSQAIVIPTTYHRRFLATKHSKMFFETSPIAVNNKIKAIQARKTRLNPVPTNSGYTDIRPLNFGYTGVVTNSKPNVTIWTADKLVDRSKDIRLDRIATRPSVLSTTSINQQSLLWPNYQSTILGNKQLQTNSNSLTTITPPAIGSIQNKSPGGKMPEIVRHRNPFTPIQPQQKTNCSERTMNNHLLIYELEEDEDEEEEEDIPIDKEFDQYLEKAIVKCADWLIKYVFNEKNN